MRRLSPSRYIPAGSIAVNYPAVNAVAYLYGPKERPLAICFSGKRNRPDMHFSYKSEEARLLSIAKWADGLQRAVDFKAERQAEKRAFVHSLKVGDILRCSWGYDQTNIDFFEVVKVCGKAVVIREIASTGEYNGAQMTGECVPVPGKFIGEEKRKLVKQGNSVKIYSFAHANLFEPKAIIAGAKIFAPSHYSCYA